VFAGRVFTGLFQSMNRDSFIALFIQHLAQPLLARGYRFVGKGQTLAYDASDLTLALIRLGGKKARPGSIAHVLCARHRFLRTLEEEAVRTADTLSVNDYPYKFRPSSLFGLPPSRWRYQPSNLGHWEYDRLDYGSLGPNEVQSDLMVLRDFLAGPAVSWASSLTRFHGPLHSPRGRWPKSYRRMARTLGASAFGFKTTGADSAKARGPATNRMQETDRKPPVGRLLRGLAPLIRALQLMLGVRPTRGIGHE